MARSTFRRFLFLALAAAVLTTACGAGPEPAHESSSASIRVLTDGLGREVRVVARPSRVITLSPNLTEIVYALGAGDRIVANTSFCDYPPEAASKPHVGDTQRPDLERIIALKPDLVLVSTASQLQSIFERLAALDIPVYVSTPNDLEGIFASIERIGEALGEPEAGRTLAASLRDRAGAVTKAVAGRPAPKVFVVVGDEPLFTAGKGTFVDDLVRRAGGVSISGDEATEWPQYSAEAVIARAPEVIVVPTLKHGISNENGGVPTTIRETPAVRDDRIVRIEGDLLMRPGPRLVDGLEALARSLHPEAF